MSAPEPPLPPRGDRRFRLLAGAAVVAAAALAVNVNVLVARYYQRWDWTRAGLYTLSPATTETLARLTEPVDVVVLLPQSDPLTGSVRHMLDAYGAVTRQLRVRHVDPDRDAAEFLAVQQQYGIEAGKTENGRLVTDASVVVSRGARRWFITTDDIVVRDEEDGRARPKLEQALTEGLRQVMEKEGARFCFSTGHQEASIDDGGPSGAAELRYRLEKNNFTVEAVDLSAPRFRLEGCQALVVAGPSQRLPAPVAARIVEYVKGGGNAVLLLTPLLDDESRVQPGGLEPVAALGGIELGLDLVVEEDPRARLPVGVGETFRAVPREHPITRGFVRGDEGTVTVLAHMAQSLKAVGPGAVTLLASSADAYRVADFRGVARDGHAPGKRPGDAGGPFTVAMAAELPRPEGSPSPHGPRLVVGSTNLAWGRNWRDPSLVGTRLFVESALSWVSARPPIVSVPDKPAQAIGLALTEESLGEVRRYVLVYLPLSAAVVGLLVMLHRRSVERRSRAQARAGGKP